MCRRRPEHVRRRADPSQLRVAAQLAKPTRPIATTKLTNDQGDNEAAHTPRGPGSPQRQDNKIPYQYNAVTPEDKKGAPRPSSTTRDVPLRRARQTSRTRRRRPRRTSKLSYANPLTAGSESRTRRQRAAATEGGLDRRHDGRREPAREDLRSACTDYQRVLSDTSTFTLLYGQPAIRCRST